MDKLRTSKRCMVLAAATLTGLYLTACPSAPYGTVRVVPEAPPLVVNETVRLVATTSTSRDTHFTWRSNTPSVAEVDAVGVVTAKAPGAATIIARGTSTGLEGTARVTIGQGPFNTTLPADPTQVAPVISCEDALDSCEAVVGIPGIAASVQRVDGYRYHRLTLPGVGTTDEAGKAAMPFFTLRFAIPTDDQTAEPADCAVQVSFEAPKHLENIWACPAQPAPWAQNSEDDPEVVRPDFTVDTQFYESSVWYPAQSHATQTIRVGNLDVLEVRVFPVRYLPAYRRLFLPGRVRVKVDFTSTNGLTQPCVLGPINASKANGESWVTSVLANPDTVRVITAQDFDRALAPIDPLVIDDEAFQLLIVTRPEFYAQARRLALWRQDRGVRVSLASLSDTTYPDAESIRTYIRGRDAANTVPFHLMARVNAMTAILIFGDSGRFPTFTGRNASRAPDPTEPGESVLLVGTDLDYAAIRGDDDWPDVALGRICVDNIDQATWVVDKIIAYESRDPADLPSHMSVYSYFDDVIWPDIMLEGAADFGVGSTVVTGAGTRFLAQLDPGDYIGGGIWGVAWTDWLLVASIESDERLTLAEPYGGAFDLPGALIARATQDGVDDWEFVKGAEHVRQFMLGRGVDVRFGYVRNSGPTPTHSFGTVPLATDLLGYGWDGDVTQIQANWRSGLDGIILYNDHGGRRKWHHPEFLVGDLEPMDDPETAHYPILLCMACDNGWFDNETDKRRATDGTITHHGATWPWDDCFASAALRCQNGGAVAAIASSRMSDADSNDRLLDGFFAAFYDDYEVGSILPGSGHPDCATLGEAMRWAQLHMASCFPGQDRVGYYMEVYHLFGDPMLELRLPEP